MNVYDSTLHELEVHGKLDALRDLLQIAEAGFPTVMDRASAADAADPEAILWLSEHNVIFTSSDESYGLVDEFLRIRMIMDAEELEIEREEAEREVLRSLNDEA